MGKSRNITENDILDPSSVLYNLINDYLEKRFDSQPFFEKASVISVDLVGGQLSDPNENPNPKNSIRARLLLDSSNVLTEEEQPVFWPLFSHDVMPIKAGEIVYVFFDGANRDSGVWVCRAPNPLLVDGTPIDNKNYIDGIDPFMADSDNTFEEMVARQYIHNTSAAIPAPQNPEEFVVENPPPPQYNARVGDRVIEGSHNSIIVLGRDRTTNTDSGLRENAGAVYVISGRSGEDIDLEADKSIILATTNSEIDANLNTAEVGKNTDPSAGIVLKSDEIRIVARNGMKIVVEGGDLFINADNITLGDGKSDEQPVVMGSDLKDLLEKILTALTAHIHPTPTGPSGPSDKAPDWTKAQAELSNTLSDMIKVKK